MYIGYYNKILQNVTQEVEELSNQTSTQVIRKMRKIFGRHGYPDIVYSDNGPCYASDEFRKFAEESEFQHVTSSPTYAQSNGLAERMVQTVKNMFRKCDETGQDRDLGLLIFRSTPLECGKSPAELLFGRRIRSNLPFKPTPQSNEGIVQSKIKQKVKQKEYHDQHAKSLGVLQTGNSVRVRDDEKNEWNEKGIVVEEVAPRSYVVKTERGRLIRRNRRDILKTQEFVDVGEDKGNCEKEKETCESTCTEKETQGIRCRPNEQNEKADEKKSSESVDESGVSERKHEEKTIVQKDVDKPVRKSSRVVKKPKRLIEEG